MDGRYTSRVPLDPHIACQLEPLRELARRYGLRSISVVGSAVTGGFEPARSDLDLLLVTDDLAEAESHITRHSVERFRLYHRLRPIRAIGETVGV